MTAENKKLSAMFHDIASIYKFMGGQPFRANAYEKGSRSIAGLPENVSSYVTGKHLEGIPGVGESLGHDVLEYLQTGRVERLDKLKKKVPFGLMELMEISGFGPASLNTLFKKLRVTTREEVVEALQRGHVEKLKGFGPKKVEAMLRGLKLHKITEDRMLLWDAKEEGEELLRWLKKYPEIKRAEIAGSIRRCQETVGDIDLVAIVKESDRAKVAKYFTNSAICKRVIVKGDTRISIITRNLERQADLRMIGESAFGSALLYFTGSRDHTIHLRTIAKSSGLRINEYGLFDPGEDLHIAGRTEAEMYKTLKMNFIPPEMREDHGEIELALRGKIPKLVEQKDIRGDLHVHSNWSDGKYSLDEIAKHVEKNFPYDYVAITDHSKSARIAGGMDEKGFLKQIRAIHEINRQLGKNLLKAGAEVDILADGSLDLSSELLAQLDWVIASIHSGFKQDNTERLIRACRNKYVHCIGHPTGRILGRRAPYGIDLKALADAALETRTALEINSQRDRMDISDEMTAAVIRNGVKVVINTDMHRLGEFTWIQMGVGIARRAWCTVHDVLNSGSWQQLRKYYL